ncbi:MAG: helix-turn-helix transcriptional regulator [Planctomycetes bacterium]|nr:helix-turn-helix transcriptional regulator [Planctomycetota bacterium]
MDDDGSERLPEGTAGLGRVVRFHRKVAGLTQQELADLAGVGTVFVREVEKGKTTVRLSTLLRVLGALGIRLEWQSPLRKICEEEVRRADGEGPGPR